MRHGVAVVCWFGMLGSLAVEPKDQVQQLLGNSQHVAQPASGRFDATSKTCPGMLP